MNSSKKTPQSKQERIPINEEIPTPGNLATNFGFGVVQGLVAENLESPEEDPEGIHLGHELSKSLAITLVGTVIGGPSLEQVY